MTKARKWGAVLLVLIFSLLAAGCGSKAVSSNQGSSASAASVQTEIAHSNYVFSYADVPLYRGEPYAVLNGNIPSFSDADVPKSYEKYSDLDSLGRSGAAFVNVGKDSSLKKKREKNNKIKPSGWRSVRYDDIIDDKYLYECCHLISFMLAGENAATEKNLFTGTRYLSTKGMLPFENKVKNYVDKTGNHVLYRVTPVFVDDELVARGVHLEAQSVEDEGRGVRFNVFCYNVQPGIEIDYSTGNSKRIQ